MLAVKHAPDGILLLLIVGLTLFGFIAVASASAVVADKFYGDPYFFVKHQLLYGGLVGLGTFLLGFLVPYGVWRPLAFPALLVCLVLLILVFVPGLHVEYGGATRWLTLGPLTFQPTEITKIAFIFYLAALLEKRGEAVRDFRKSVVPLVIMAGLISTLIMFQPDMGTMLSIIMITAAMVFVAGFRLRHLAAVGMAALAMLAILLNTAKYRLERIMVYLHPELDPQGVGYQINQALLAVGTGSWWGLGLGRSRQKYYYLPEPAGDSIFAIIAEELGFVRTTVMMVVFMLIGWRGFAIARNAPDTFGRLIATGITAWIIFQAFINIGSILGVTPLTGVPLPFISYGGSALATILFATGVLLNISQYATINSK